MKKNTFQKEQKLKLKCTLLTLQYKLELVCTKLIKNSSNLLEIIKYKYNFQYIKTYLYINFKIINFQKMYSSVKYITRRVKSKLIEIYIFEKY